MLHSLFKIHLWFTCGFGIKYDVDISGQFLKMHLSPSGLKISERADSCTVMDGPQVRYFLLPCPDKRADMSPLGDSSLWGEGGGGRTAANSLPENYRATTTPSDSFYSSQHSFMQEYNLFSSGTAFRPPLFQVLKYRAYMHMYMYMNTCWLDGTLNSRPLVFNLWLCMCFLNPDYIMIWHIGQLR